MQIKTNNKVGIQPNKLHFKPNPSPLIFIITTQQNSRLKLTVQSLYCQLFRLKRTQVAGFFPPH